jgi:hypothetical protein
MPGPSTDAFPPVLGRDSNPRPPRRHPHRCRRHPGQARRPHRSCRRCCRRRPGCRPDRRPRRTRRRSPGGRLHPRCRGRRGPCPGRLEETVAVGVGLVHHRTKRDLVGVVDTVAVAILITVADAVAVGVGLRGLVTVIFSCALERPPRSEWSGAAFAVPTPPSTRARETQRTVKKILMSCLRSIVKCIVLPRNSVARLPLALGRGPRLCVPTSR